MTVRVALVGAGYWGPNVMRNLASLGGVTVSAVCDLDAGRAQALRQRYCPAATVTTRCADLAVAADVDAVVLATPIRTHFELAKLFLGAGKHVLVEKPLAQTSAQCRQLIELAGRNSLVLMVGHVFEFSAAVRQVKDYLACGELGKLLYVTSQRANLGRVQRDVNALWSLGPHDISILNSWLDDEPCRVAARGFSYLSKDVEDLVFVTLEYRNGLQAHLHLGWLDPRKTRTMSLVGTRKMLVYDELSAEAQVQVHDKGIDGLEEFLADPAAHPDFAFATRSDAVVIPTVRGVEPLNVECRHFVDCVERGERPVTDGENGLRVVRALEAAGRSLERGGEPVEL